MTLGTMRSWLVDVVALMVAVTALILVKWIFIATGPSWRAAATAVRIAEAEMARARGRDGQPPIRLREADAVIGEAWSHLDEGRYEDSIAAAREVKRILKD